jgi:hypothetical protein
MDKRCAGCGRPANSIVPGMCEECFERQQFACWQQEREQERSEEEYAEWLRTQEPGEET